VTKPDLYPPPHMDDLAARLAGCKVFSTLDLRKGYHQVPLREEDVEKTAIITPFGLYEYVRMPFGLRNAGQTFQRLMDRILGDLPFAFTFMDDVLLASVDHQQHESFLRVVLQRLAEQGLVLNEEKCVLGQSQVVYLGQLVSEHGVVPVPEKVSAITAHPEPVNRGQLLSFLGMINFYRKFIRGAASILRPLTDATRGKGGRATPITWSEEMKTSFLQAKEALKKATMLAHPVEGAKLSLAVDASDHHIGGVLQQWDEPRGWRPLGFFSRKLSDTEKRYSAFDRELVAAVSSVRHFRHMLEGRQFTIYTDHKPLTYALHRTTDPWSARQQRHLAYLAEMTADIQHVPGKENVVADTLSRPVAALVPATKTVALDWSSLAVQQKDDPEVLQLLASSSLQLKEVQVEGATILCDTATGAWRPLLTASFRRPAFDQVHTLAHAGVKATTRMISSRFVWPGLATDVKEWCRDCGQCSRGKVVPGQSASTVEKIDIPATRFYHIHLDVVGPLPTTATGNRYLITMVDRTSRWPEAVPVTEVDTETILQTLVSTWVARFGLPGIVTTDRGPQFTSGRWTTWCEEMGVTHKKTTAFHPQSNGMVERIHRQIKDGLRAREAKTEWDDHLPWVMLGLRAAPKDESAVSAGEAVFGQQLALPGHSHLGGTNGESVGRAPPAGIPETRRTYAEVVASPSLLDASWVYIHKGGSLKPLENRYEGPFRVVRRDPKTFTVQRGGTEEVVSKDRLKPHLGRADPQAAQPRRRGRPPGTGGV